MVRNYKVGYGRERARQGDSYPVERDRSEEVKAMRSGLKWVACLPPEALVMSRPGSQLLSRSVTPITTEGEKDKDAQSWPHPSLTAALGRTDIVLYQLQHWGEQVLNLACLAQ